MRILIISQYFWPENFRINDLATYFQSRGHEITILTGIPNYPNGKIFKEFKKNPNNYLNKNGIEVIRVPLITRGKTKFKLFLNYLSFGFSASTIGLWKLKKRNFDIILVNQLSPPIVGVPGVFFSKMKQIPLAIWVLDLWPDTLQGIHIFKSNLILNIIKKIVSFIYKHSDLIFVQSKRFTPRIRLLAAIESKIEYLPSWAEDIFKTQHIQREIEIPNDKNKFKILFAGNIGEAQDFPCILNTAERLKENKNIQWLIVGDGRMKKWVESEIKRRKLSNQVLLLGSFPIECMPSFYKRADALLITLQNKPVFSWTIPGKLQSYLAAGKPIIGALNGEAAELIRNSGAGFVCDAGDYNKFADLILKTSYLSQLERKNIGVKSKILSDKEFNRLKLLSMVESCFKNLIKNKVDNKDL